MIFPCCIFLALQRQTHHRQLSAGRELFPELNGGDENASRQALRIKDVDVFTAWAERVASGRNGNEKIS